MAKKKAKKARRKVGRPRTRGETVGVSFRIPKELLERVDRLKRSIEKTRTDVLETLIKAGLVKSEPAKGS